MAVIKCQQFYLAVNPCILREVRQIANEGGYEVLKSLTGQAIWFQGGLCSSGFLLYAGIMGSILRNHVGWNAAAGIGGLGVIGTGWFLHRTIQQIVPLLNARLERLGERRAMEAQNIQIPHQLQE
jgi:hypothetical protein